MVRARLFASLMTVAAASAAVSPPVAHAQRPSKADRERAAKARDAFDDGKKAYNLGDFDRAIELWKQGYEYKDDPIFLFNIAQAYRQRGDHQKAIFFYRAYLREDPKARNRDEVDARITELQRLIEAQQTAVDAPPKGPVTPATEPPARVEPTPTTPVPTAAVPEAPARDEAPAHPGRGLKIGGLAAGGAGVAAAVTGILFLLRSSSIESDLEDAAASGMPWTPELVDKESQGKSAQTIGFIAIGAGAAFVITGATLYVMGARKDAQAAHELSLVPIVGRTTGLALQLPF